MKYKSYILHSENNIGRRKLIKQFANNINAEIYLVDNLKNKDLLEKIPEELDYVIIFKDFVYEHKNFKQLFDKLILEIEQLSEWKMIYLDVGCDNKENFIQKIDKYVDSFAFVINKSTFDKDNKDPLYITTEPLVQHYNNMQITHNYNITKSVPMYIITINNVKKTEQILNLCDSFRPIYEPIIIHLGYPNYTMTRYLNSLNIMFKNVHSVTELYNTIQEELPSRFKTKYYLITNIFINWTIKNDDLFSDIKNLLVDNDIININIRQCPMCNNDMLDCFIMPDIEDRIDSHIDVLSGFSIIKRHADLTSSMNIKTVDFNNRTFYSIKECNMRVENIKYFNLYHNMDVEKLKIIFDQNIMLDSFWLDLLDFRIDNLSNIKDILTNGLISSFYTNLTTYFTNKSINIKKCDSKVIHLSEADRYKFHESAFKEIGVLYKWEKNSLNLSWTINELLNYMDYTIQQKKLITSNIDHITSTQIKIIFE